MSVRIQRLSIRNFGPLRDFVLLPGPVTVVYGQNEAGKTSCIDALVRALRERVQPGREQLIEQTREGPGFQGEIDLLLDPEDGGSVLELLREHPSLARLFIVRDADPSLQTGRSWLNSIRDRLVGIDLVRISELIRNRARLTVNGTLRDAHADERQRLSERVARIEAFLDDLPGIGKLQEEIHQVELQRTAARNHGEKLRGAERFERFRTAERAVGTLRENERRLQELERFGDNDLLEWREAISALREAAAIAKTAENESSRLRSELDLAEEESKKRRLARDRGIAEAEAVQSARLAEDLEEARTAAANAGTWSLWKLPLGAGGGLLLLLSIALITQATDASGTHAASMGLAAGTAATFGLIAAALSITASSRIRHAAAVTEDLLARARAHLGEVQSLSDCSVQLQKSVIQHERLEGELVAAKSVVESIEERELSARKVEEDRIRSLDAAQRQIAAIRNRVGLSSIEQLEAKTRERGETKALRIEAQKTLSSLLGNLDDTQLIEDQLEPLRVEDPGMGPNPQKLAVLESELEAFDARFIILRSQLTERLDRSLASIGLDDIGKLRAERIRLRRAVEQIDNQTKGANLALQGLRELSSDIDRPLREALGNGPEAAGHYLSKLTAGRYRAITLEGTQDLSVERDDGSRFPVEALSRGARDQLALAIRLSLVRRLLGEPGFLVLDDAFLTSDAGRREALTASLAELAAEGWQILYFTFDPVLRDNLGRLDAKVIELPPPNRID
jgi:hypothetical protein